MYTPFSLSSVLLYAGQISWGQNIIWTTLHTHTSLHV